MATTQAAARLKGGGLSEKIAYKIFGLNFPEYNLYSFQLNLQYNITYTVVINWEHLI